MPFTSYTKKLFLFNLDGTLTEPGKPISSDMKSFLKEISKSVFVGIATGSDHQKVLAKLNNDLRFFHFLHYVFCDNGSDAYRSGKPFYTRNISDHISQLKMHDFINFCLRYIADLDIPIKTGRFIEFRGSMFNVCLIGRDCSQEERDLFAKLDQGNGIRKKFVKCLTEKFGDNDFRFSIGGQISVDVSPVGWDKSYCLTHIGHTEFDTIHFFGSKTKEGENDYELFVDPRVVPHKVTDPEDTKLQIQEILLRKPV